MGRAFIALGANLNQPRRQVLAAFAELAAMPGVRMVRRSSLYRTAPVGYLDQPDFINAVCEIETTMKPQELLAALLSIERCHGRVRQFPNSPRTLDLDILLYDDLSLQEHGLILPHPRMHQRAFVLEPLREIAPDLEVPGQGRVEDLARAMGESGIERLGAGRGQAGQPLPRDQRC